MKRRIFVVGLLVLLGSAHGMMAGADATTPSPKPPDDMVLVPAGDFIMGTDERDSEGPNHPRGWDDARPRHTVTLPAFFIDKTEVTNEQYKAFCTATSYPMPPQWVNGTFPDGQDKYPVTRVSWWEAVAYAKWKGKRLPTEPEWEKAARGTDGRLYPWGNNWDTSYTVWDTDGPQNVATKPQGASPYGALDMTGNVFEWTADWYDAYPNAPIRFAQYGQQFKVIRGGAWWGGESLGRTYYRCVMRPGSRTEMIGFRCAQDAK